jgi:hypothetical protein
MKREVQKLILLSLLATFLIGFHQFYFYGVWFQLEDLHHETFMVGLLCVAFGLIVGDRMRHKR